MSRRVGEKRISLIDLSLRARQNDRYIEGYPLKLVVAILTRGNLRAIKSFYDVSDFVTAFNLNRG